MQEEYIKYENTVKREKSGLMAKINGFLVGKLFVPLIIILVAVIGFSLGCVSALQSQKEPVKIIDNSGEVKGVTTENPTNNLQNNTTTASVPVSSSGQVVASKNGTKYHYPWCAGARQISSQNLVTFNSIEAARAAGFTPAANCKGLK